MNTASDFEDMLATFGFEETGGGDTFTCYACDRASFQILFFGDDDNEESDNHWVATTGDDSDAFLSGGFTVETLATYLKKKVGRG